MRGYRFVAEQYRPGDRISVFGFSRGAYTARTLVGMIGTVGIVARAGLTEKQLAVSVQQAFAQYRTLRDERRTAAGHGADAEVAPASMSIIDKELMLAYDPRSDDIPVAFLGVWDTVGALGIPSYVGIPDLLRSRERYEFMNVILDSRVAHARHAVSLDEMRGPFRPTLWEEPPAGTKQDIKQVWFPGDHSDVGGGHEDTGLSDGALKWMIDEAEAAVGLPFEPTARNAITPDPGTRAPRGPRAGVRGAAIEVAFQPRPRATPVVDHSRPLPDRIAEYAYERQRRFRHLPRDEQYRPSRTLVPGEMADVRIEADRGWNATGLYLEGGEYRFAATGEWSTAFGRCGPGGLKRWPVVGDGFGVVVDWIERGLRSASRNPKAELAGARREADEPLMVLIGVVANEVTDAQGRVAERAGTPSTDQKLIIGEGLDAVVERPGYLWAYANDAWGAYGNNHGRVTLTVTRRDAVEDGVQL